MASNDKRFTPDSEYIKNATEKYLSEGGVIKKLAPGPEPPNSPFAVCGGDDVEHIRRSIFSGITGDR
jgi:hypothetical protein